MLAPSTDHTCVNNTYKNMCAIVSLSPSLISSSQLTVFMISLLIQVIEERVSAPILINKHASPVRKEGTAFVPSTNFAAFLSLVSRSITHPTHT
jgi:hypothetical protein